MSHDKNRQVSQFGANCPLKSTMESLLSQAKSALGRKFGLEEKSETRRGREWSKKVNVSYCARPHKF